MPIGADQHIKGQKTVSQQISVKQYQQTISTKRQAAQNAVSANAVAGDRVELSTDPLYTANLIFEKIANRVAERYGVDAAEQIQFDPNLDTSPVATAERIFTFATGFFQRYLEQNAGKEPKENLDRFMSIIRGAIDQGFGEAQGVLTGLSSLTSEIEGTINETYEQLQNMLNGFEEDQLRSIGSVEGASQEDVTDGSGGS